MTHEATVGKIGADQVFYLMSQGLTENRPRTSSSRASSRSSPRNCRWSTPSSSIGSSRWRWRSWGERSISTTTGALTDDQLQEVDEAHRQSDSVELKLTVADDQRRAATRAQRDRCAERPDQAGRLLRYARLRLNKAGVVVRATRAGQGRRLDHQAPARQPEDLSRRLRKTPGFVVEVDAIPGAFVCSGALTASLKNGSVWEALRGDRPVKLFSKEQRAFFEAHAPAGIGLDDLSMLGPIFVRKLMGAEDFARPMMAEAVAVPDPR